MNLSNRWPAWPQWLLAAGAAAAAAGASAPLRAQTASTTTAVAAPAAAQQIEVTGQRETLPADQEPSQRLSGEQLRRRAAPTLGATLQDEPGVANASFGPNVGLPVIRGLSGTRVRALFGGAGAFDASTFSADHA
jgi:iron complex outermembrane receptor protein